MSKLLSEMTNEEIAEFHKAQYESLPDEWCDLCGKQGKLGSELRQWSVDYIKLYINSSVFCTCQECAKSVIKLVEDKIIKGPYHQNNMKRRYKK